MADPKDLIDKREPAAVWRGVARGDCPPDAVEQIEQLSAERATVDVRQEESPGTRYIDWRTLWAYTGPGWLMSMAYLDPGNLESDLQAGAYAGYQLLWVLFWSTAFGLVLQVMAARLGVVTGKNLAECCRLEYSRPVSLALFVMTQIAIIGSDIQEVVGSAIAFKVLSNGAIPLWAGCIITGLDTFSFLLLQRAGMRFLEAFFTSLIFIMAICFWINFGKAEPDSAAIAYGTVVPDMHSYAVVQAVGLLGAVIMPHNIYLHSALVQSRKVERTGCFTPGSAAERKVQVALKYNAWESGIALLFSFFINLAVVGAFSEMFFADECAQDGDACLVESAAYDDDGLSSATTPCTTSAGVPGKCTDVGLANAGAALGVALGSAAKYVFAVGVLAAGQASTMTGTYAGQYVMEGFLQLKIPNWARVAATRLCSLGPAIAVALATSSNKSASDQLDEWLNILQSVQLPFALLPVLHFTSSERVMGQFRNTRGWNAVCWLLALIVMVANVYLVVSTIQDPTGPAPHTSGFYALVGIFAVLYFAFIGFLVYDDARDAFAAVGVGVLKRGASADDLQQGLLDA
eukprot:g1356.t1